MAAVTSASLFLIHPHGFDIAMFGPYQRLLNWELSSPRATWVIVLAVISFVEYLIMRLLSHIVGSSSSLLTAAVVDSVLLTMIAAPLLWFTIVRPLRQAARARERFVDNLFGAIEDERRRIAHEVHDGVGQSVMLLISGLRSLSQAGQPDETRGKERELLSYAQQALADLKRVSLGLRPSLLDDFGLKPAIEHLVAEVQAHSSLKVRVDLEAVAERRFGDDVETHLYRIIQESLNNIVKHAAAANVELLLMRDGESLRLEINDDGIGIEPTRLDGALRSGGHLGMIGMRQRAKLLGGDFAVAPNGGRGTRIIVSLPFPRITS